VPFQPEPVRVGQHFLHDICDRRLDHSRLDPGIDPAADLAATQPVTAIGQHQLTDRIAGALDLDALEPASGVRPLPER
jgi:hypothetical protein